jgi:hypothetical protein
MTMRCRSHLKSATSDLFCLSHGRHRRARIAGRIAAAASPARDETFIDRVAWQTPRNIDGMYSQNAISTGMQI